MIQLDRLSEISGWLAAFDGKMSTAARASGHTSLDPSPLRSGSKLRVKLNHIA